MALDHAYMKNEEKNIRMGDIRTQLLYHPWCPDITATNISLDDLRDKSDVYTENGYQNSSGEAKLSNFRDSSVWGVKLYVKNETDSVYDNADNAKIKVSGDRGALGPWQAAAVHDSWGADASGQIEAIPVDLDSFLYVTANPAWGSSETDVCEITNLGGSGYYTRLATYKVRVKDSGSGNYHQFYVQTGLGADDAWVSADSTNGSNGNWYPFANQSSSTYSSYINWYYPHHLCNYDGGYPC